MSRNRGAWLASAAAGLLIAGVGTASAASAAPPVAQPHWHTIFTAPKIKPANQFTQDVTAVVATGKTSGFAFIGNGGGVAETAWQRTSATHWKKVSFPGSSTESVTVAAASSPSNVWAFADNSFNASRVLRWTGTKFAVVKTPFGGGSIWGANVLGPKDVWVYGLLPGGFQAPAIGVWHYNGSSWKLIGKNISGGSALNDHDVWGFTATAVEHWNGSKWTATSVKKLLPPVDPHGLNDPTVVGVLALSHSNVYAIGSANTQDEGGPVVVLHFNGSKWSKVASGEFGYGPFYEQVSSDGGGGLWLPMNGPAGGTSYLVHFAAGKLTKAATPGNPQNLTIESVSRIPGTAQQLAGGFTHKPFDRGTNVVAVILQYS